MAGRFPLLTDENVSGPIVQALGDSGWDVLRVVDVFGERSIDDALFAWAAEHGRVVVTTDRDCLRIARRWLEEGRPFRMVWWEQGERHRVRPGPFLAAFAALAASTDAFASSIEYLKLE